MQQQVSGTAVWERPAACKRCSVPDAVCAAAPPPPPLRSSCRPGSCLLAKTYNAAAPLLDVELTDVDPQRTATGPTDLLLYCYYGGMVATGVLA